jgi:transposase
MPVGRKSKLIPEVQERVCKGIEAGMTQESAAINAGIGESTYYRWLERGEKAKSGKYKEFWEEVQASFKKIRGRLEFHAHRVAIPHEVVTVREVIEPKTGKIVELKTTTTEMDSPMARFILERRYSDDWAKKEKIDITTGDKPLSVNLFGPVGFGSVGELPKDE